MPASTRICGPRFGNRPEIISERLSTAATPASTSASAVGPSRSTWSSTAMSPAERRARQGRRTTVGTGGADDAGSVGPEPSPELHHCASSCHGPRPADSRQVGAAGLLSAEAGVRRRAARRGPASSSSRGVGQRGLRLLQPGEHPGQLAPPPGVVEHGDTPHVVTEPSLASRPRGGGRRTPRPAGRWVTTSTCADAASRASRRPTSTAALPPTPASTSSKTKVGTGLVPARHTSRASITRDSSPPEAPLASGPRLAPGVGGQQRISTSSTPVRAEPEPAAADREPSSRRSAAHRRRAGVRHRQAGQLAGQLGGEPRGGRRRACGSAAGGAAEAARGAARRGAPSSPAIRSSLSSSSASRAADVSAQASTSSSGARRTCGSARCSAARRSETAASRAGSASTRAA